MSKKEIIDASAYATADAHATSLAAVIQSIGYLHDYCESMERCEDCPLYQYNMLTECNTCVLAGTRPCDWQKPVGTRTVTKFMY